MVWGSGRRLVAKLSAGPHRLQSLLQREEDLHQSTHISLWAGCLANELISSRGFFWRSVCSHVFCGCQSGHEEVHTWPPDPEHDLQSLEWPPGSPVAGSMPSPCDVQAWNLEGSQKIVCLSLFRPKCGFWRPLAGPWLQLELAGCWGIGAACKLRLLRRTPSCRWRPLP